MARNKINDLRDHLFATLEQLRDKDDPMDIDRARAIAEVGKVLVESAKVEVDFIKATGADAGSGFIPEERPGLQAADRAGVARMPGRTVRGA